MSRGKIYFNFILVSLHSRMSIVKEFSKSNHTYAVCTDCASCHKKVWMYTYHIFRMSCKNLCTLMPFVNSTLHKYSFQCSNKNFCDTIAKTAYVNIPYLIGNALNPHINCSIWSSSFFAFVRILDNAASSALLHSPF